MTIPFHGSYAPNDVTFLLKPLTHVDNLPPEEKEYAIQTGERHYSEMLTPELLPSREYLALFDSALRDNIQRMAQDCVTLSHAIVNQYQGKTPIIISLARAGTPVGVALKHLLSNILGKDIAHYSISIIRDRGIDVNALNFIKETHGGDGSNWVFVDGWTGKGVITAELNKSIAQYNHMNAMNVSSRLYVLSDLAGVAGQAASFDDYLIPSAILNSTVSGLVSRSVLNHQISDNDFHGCLYYRNFESQDQSQPFITKILEQAVTLTPDVIPSSRSKEQQQRIMQEFIKHLSDEFIIKDWNLIKPGLGEATRVLLRRVPDRLLLKDLDSANVQHLQSLAREKGVTIEHRPHLPFAAVSLIKSIAS